MPQNKNGSGSVYYDKSKKLYYASITTPAGRRVKKSFPTKTAAQVWVTAQVASINSKTFVEPNNITLGRWAITWLKTYKKGAVKQRTYEKYRNMLKDLAPIASIKLQELQPVQVQQLYAKMTISANSINKVHKLLKQLYTKAYILDMVPKNIMVAVAAPRFERKEIEIFSPLEIRAILDACLADYRLKRYYPIILLGATAGMRIGEILGLRWCDVFFHTSQIYIRNIIVNSDDLGLIRETPKTKAGKRKITLPEYVMEELRKLKQNAPTIDIKQEQLCFLTKNRTPLAPNNVERRWGSIVRLSGVPYRNFHVLRHTHATELLAAGVPIVEVARRLGHSKISHTLELYGHAIPSYDNKIVDKINDIYSIPGQ